MQIKEGQPYSITIKLTSVGSETDMEVDVSFSEDPSDEDTGPYPNSYRLGSTIMAVILAHFQKEEIIGQEGSTAS